MTKDVAFKKGEKFIEFGNVYVVTKMEIRDYDGEKKRVICYEHYFKSDLNGDNIICSIPEDSLNITNIRKPISKDDLKEIIKIFSSKSRQRKIRIETVKDILINNDPFETAKAIKRLDWESKRDSISISKNMLLKKLKITLSKEIALVMGKTPEKALREIDRLLSDGKS